MFWESKNEGGRIKKKGFSLFQVSVSFAKLCPNLSSLTKPKAKQPFLNSRLAKNAISFPFFYDEVDTPTSNGIPEPPLAHDVCQSKNENRALISQCQSLTYMKLWENRMINKAHAKRGGGIIIFIKIVFFSLMKRDVNKIYNTNTSTGMHGQTSIECSILRRELASHITKGTTSNLPFTNRSNSPPKKCSLTLSFLFSFSLSSPTVPSKPT